MVIDGTDTATFAIDFYVMLTSEHVTKCLLTTPVNKNFDCFGYMTKVTLVTNIENV